MGGGPSSYGPQNSYMNGNVYFHSHRKPPRERGTGDGTNFRAPPQWRDETLIFDVMKLDKDTLRASGVL